MLRYVEVLSIYDNLLQTNWFVSLRVCVCVWGGGGGGGGGASQVPQSWKYYLLYSLLVQTRGQRGYIHMYIQGISKYHSEQSAEYETVQQYPYM